MKLKLIITCILFPLGLLWLFFFESCKSPKAQKWVFPVSLIEYDLKLNAVENLKLKLKDKTLNADEKAILLMKITESEEEIKKSPKWNECFPTNFDSIDIHYSICPTCGKPPT
jgi:hypothetical protein